MAKYDLLHEASTPDEEIAQRHGVHTFDQYKVDPSVTNSYTPLQQVAFTLCYAIHVGGDMPRCLIINRKMALRFVEAGQEIPKRLEGIPLAFDEHMLFQTAWLG